MSLAQGNLIVPLLCFGGRADGFLQMTNLLRLHHPVQVVGCVAPARRLEAPATTGYIKPAATSTFVGQRRIALSSPVEGSNIVDELFGGLPIDSIVDQQAAD